MDIKRYVEDLVARMDPGQEKKILDTWMEFGQGRNEKGPFLPKGRRPSASSLDWPEVNVNDTLEDRELMLYDQLRYVHMELLRGSNEVLSIRPNYGVGTLVSMFGAEPYRMPREMNTLPNVHAIGGERIRKLIDAPIRFLENGYGPQMMETTEYFQRILSEYQVLREYVLIENPDLQGPMDNAELLWGSDIFYELYEEPELVHAMLHRITEAMQEVLDQWLQLVPGKYGIFTSGLMVPGHILIRNDSAMNLSPEFFEEFIVPYDSKLLAKYGGAVHFCGRGDHYISIMCRQEGLNGVHMLQPHLNDMDVIFKNTIDKGIPLTAAYHPAALEGHRAEHLYFLWNPVAPEPMEG